MVKAFFVCEFDGGLCHVRRMAKVSGRKLCKDHAGASIKDPSFETSSIVDLPKTGASVIGLDRDPPQSGVGFSSPDDNKDSENKGDE